MAVLIAPPATVAVRTIRRADQTPASRRESVAPTMIPKATRPKLEPYSLRRQPEVIHQDERR
ncbi:MAG: hypothetical protein IPI33_15200 [Dehalococcoidia bacterium]|nr:hypothetical protein [Dehalococcoidia bacterium]